ncbi:uncharacterized protein BYT42DRAFT_557553 [Radiomyces spectabilis]|uniref:uncharacterized protein n=1 Tax=Radiomyces spectabilis TaxID=64574 RepID=UPI002220F561|nr:uncharacterized protein BYT42DRAFT_557553 [Radiomyces spectabilis]KAI8391634.1 hypothetical protein BYT42DRAFT_557553 [Radiomyces spectabilis]
MDTRKYSRQDGLLLSPPVTPKIQLRLDASPEHDDMMLLPPALSMPQSPPQWFQALPSKLNRRKSSAKSFNRAMALSSEGAFSVPVLIPSSSLPSESPIAYRKTHCSRKTQRARRSPSDVRGAFTMDVFSYDPPVSQSNSDSLPQKRKIEEDDEAQEIQDDQMTTPRVTHISNDRHIKKAMTDAAAVYDRIDLSLSDEAVMEPQWVPSLEVFDNRPPVRVVWKGSPLPINHLPYYERLHPGEVAIASTLRLTPEQYLKCKRTLVLAAQDFARHGMSFRKSDAQKFCRIDVNKTSTLWCAFNRLGWFVPRSL